MIRVAQGLHARQVMAAGQGQIVAEAMRPGFADEAVLTLKLGALFAADRGDQGYGRSGPVADRADKSGGCFVEPEVLLQERRADQGLQVVQARNADGAAEHVPRQVVRHERPVGGQHHGGEMGTGGMPGHHDAAPVDAELRHVAVKPSHRAQHLPHHFLDRGCRGEAVVGHGHGDSGADEGRREEGKIPLVQRAPVAAMDENQQRRVRHASGVEVERFGGRRAETIVRFPAQFVTGGARFGAPPLKYFRMIRDCGTGVVLMVELLRGQHGEALARLIFCSGSLTP